MKKLLFVLIVTVLSLHLVQAAAYPNIIVSGYEIKDGEAAVGKDFTLAIMLENTEPSVCAQSITTTLQAGDPFIIRSISASTTGTMCSGGTKEVDFPMRIDPTAQGGFYQIQVTNSFETNLLAQYTSSSVINVFVAGSPNITANVANSKPIDVYPGNTATLTINVENKGTFEAQSVDVSLSADAPLEVQWSNTYAALGTLLAKQSKTATFTVDVPKDAAAKDYPMILHAKYMDENLASKQVEVPLTFHVKPKALFTASEAGSETLYANDDTKVVRLSLTNTGTDTAYKIKLNLQPQFPFSTDGSSRYVESLAPGQSIPVDFVVNVDKDATVGSYGLDMLLNFEDNHGKLLSDTTKVQLTVSHKSILRAVFIDYWFLWVIAVIVAARVLLKKKKKK